jgi:hypothetical protein
MLRSAMLSIAMRRQRRDVMTSHGSVRLLAMLCAGYVLAPAAAAAGSLIDGPHYYNGGSWYGPSYQAYAPAPYHYPAARPPKTRLHLHLNGQGNIVRSLDGGNQIVVYDRECRVHNEIVPSARGPHRITVTRC